MEMRKKGLVGFFLSITVFSLLLGCSSTHKEEGTITLDVWHPWGGEPGKDFRAFMEYYNQNVADRFSPPIRVRPLFAPNDLSANQKFFLSVAAGVPPEVIFVDGPQVAEWGARGALLPLNDFIQEAGIKPEDFWQPCWKQTVFRGKVYALTFCADPNFAFFWNKKVFRDAGLDPEKPPRTLAELDEYAEKITKFDERGNMVRIGIIPWGVYGMANSIYTWGWAFGGKFYDPNSETVSCDDPKIVQALEWMVSYAKKYDIRKISALTAGFGTAEQNPFFTGKLGMMPAHITMLREIDKYAPDLEYGIALMPYPEGGEDPSWVGGWCIGIPRGAKNQKEAFEFIKWLCTSPEGTLAAARLTGSFPGYKYSPAYEEAERDPRKSVFLSILRTTKHQRPVMPAQAFMMGELTRAVDAALYGRKSPEEALRDARERIQEHLDWVLKKSMR